MSDEIDADKADTISAHPSAGDVEQKNRTDSDPVKRSRSNQKTNKKSQSPERNLAPVENQALLSMAMEISRMGAWEHDRASGAVYWSPELEEIYGLEPGSFPGTRDAFYELVHEEDRDRIFADVEDSVLEHRAYSIEFRFYHADGSIGWMEGRGEAVYSEGDEPVRVYGVGIDITERKSAEEALRKSEERYRRIVSQNLTGIAETDLTGQFTLVNDQYCEIVGYTREELLSGKKIQDITHPDDLPRNIELLEKCVTEGTPYEMEKRYVRRDGSAVWVHNSTSSVAGADGKPQSLAVTVIDIGERKQAEEMRTKLASIVESSDDAIVSKDLNGIIMSWNRGAENLFGYTAAEVLGKSITILIPDDHPNEEATILERIRRGESVDHYETVRQRKDGKRLNISLTVSPVFNADDKVVGASKIARDITESKQVESNRRLLFDISEIIRRSDRAGDLLYAVAAATGEHFGASRCLFNEIEQDANRETVHRDYHDGVESVAGVHRLTDYSPVASAEMANGKTVVNFDSKIDERTADDYENTYKPASERAYVAIPLLRNGRWVASLWVSQSEPRRWTAQEVGLLETIAERTWLAVESLRSESALRKSEEQYRTLFDLVPVAVYTCDADGSITAYNQNAITLWGREPEQGERFNGSFKMYYPDGRPMPREEGPMARILNGETLEDGEDEILIERPDMARKVVIALPKLLKDRLGNINGGINCLYDVTELKIAQRALIRAERRAANDYQELLQHIVPLGQKLGAARDLTTVYRAVHDFICSSMDCSAFFVSFYNPQTKLRTAAYAWGEGEEIDISLLPPMPISPEGGSNSQAILDKKSIVTNRYWDTMKDRPHVVLMENGIDPMSSLVVPMMVKNSVIGTLEVQAHEDRAFTTEHIVALEMVANLAAVAIENVRLLEAHDKARQEAEAANRTKDEFLSVLSHELRTPLNSMMGWIRMMRLGNLDTDQTAKAMEVIDRNTRVQSSLIEDLLDVSRIISGKMRVEKELADLAAAVKTAATAIRPIAEAKNISFDINIGTEPLFTDGDPVRLQQVATNLLQNAIKFTPEFGTVSVTVTRSRSDAIIEVQDSGIGIDQDLLPNIFERFRQGDASTKRGFAGLGLGLTIVRTIVELHGGEITATSDGKDRGSLFRVRLPLTEVLYAEDPKSDLIGGPLPPDHSLKGLKILLVDDDTDSVKPLALFLQGKKAEVITTDSAAAALRELAEGQFDILITDIGMPGIDGFELLREIRSSLNGASNIPAIAVTAYASAGDRTKAIETGFQHHLAKPIDYEELLNAVKSLRASKGAGFSKSGQFERGSSRLSRKTRIREGR